MRITRRGVLGAAGAAAVGLRAGRARAQGPTLKLGVLGDMSGVYRDISGPGSVTCCKQAVADFKATGKNLNVDVVFGDHQNKSDVGTAVARQWFDQDGVDVILDVPNSGVGLAVAGVCKEKDKVYINSGSASADLTGKACAPTTIHWTYDTWMLAHSTGGAMVKSGGKNWFFITADYTFGHTLEADTTKFILAAGGKVLGSVKAPIGTTDFSSYLLQAQASGAQVIGLANAGLDTVNSIKQAAEFGIDRATQKLAGLLVFISDVNSLGLDVAQGLVLTETFYWDLNDRTRALTKRVRPQMGSLYPGMGQAGVYAGAFHYLKTAAEMGAAEAKKSGAATVAKMKSIPTDDDAFGPGRIREDGRALHPAYLFEVKKPSESKGPWDYYKLIATTPADEAFRPMNEGGCPLVKA